MLRTKHGIKEIVCISVNDPYVMSAWGLVHSTRGKIRMLADPTGKFVESLGMAIDIPPLGGKRSKRFAMVVDNGEIVELKVEPDGVGLTCSLAEHIDGIK